MLALKCNKKATRPRDAGGISYRLERDTRKIQARPWSRGLRCINLKDTKQAPVSKWRWHFHTWRGKKDKNG